MAHDVGGVKQVNGITSLSMGQLIRSKIPISSIYRYYLAVNFVVKESKVKTTFRKETNFITSIDVR